VHTFYCDQLIGSHSEMVFLYSVRAVNLQTKSCSNSSWQQLRQNCVGISGYLWKINCS